MFRLRVFGLVLAWTAAPAIAHHGRDFLIAQDYFVPDPLTGILYGNFEFASRDGPDEWTFEPGIQFGLVPRLSFGLTADFGDGGDGWDYRSLSPQLQFQLTDPGMKVPIRFAVLAGYQFAEENGEHADEPATAARVSPRHDGHHDGDEEPAAESHVHSGIHQHGSDGFFGRLIMETDLTAHDKVVANLICVSPGDGETACGYAAGWRHSFTHDFAMGLEAIGDFDSDGWHELVAAAYVSPAEGLALKFGIGAGLTDDSPGLTVRGGVVWRF